MENVALESGVSSNPCDDSSNKESPRLGASRERALLPYGGGGVCVRGGSPPDKYMYSA